MAPLSSPSSQHFRLGVVDAHPRVQSRLCEMVSSVAPPRAFMAVDALVASAGSSPLVVVGGPSTVMPAALHDLGLVARERPHTAVVLAVQYTSAELLQAAKEAGISDVIELTTESDRLAEAVRTASGSVVQGQWSNRGTTGNVISVFSPKGGSGKTVVATNLAVALTQREEKPIALLDADLQFGDVAVMLKLQPRHTVADAAAHLDTLDSSMLDNLFTRHEPSGLLVLPSPFEPPEEGALGGPTMRVLIDQMTASTRRLVVDLPSVVSEATLAVLEKSDLIVVVVNMDIPSVKDVKVGLQILRRLGVSSEQIYLVANRVSGKDRLDVRDVEKTLHAKVDEMISVDEAIPMSLSHRASVVLDAPRSGAAKAFCHIADQVIERLEVMAGKPTAASLASGTSRTPA